MLLIYTMGSARITFSMLFLLLFWAIAGRAELAERALSLDGQNQPRVQPKKSQPPIKKTARIKASNRNQTGTSVNGRYAAALPPGQSLSPASQKLPDTKFRTQGMVTHHPAANPTCIIPPAGVMFPPPNANYCAFSPIKIGQPPQSPDPSQQALPMIMSAISQALQSAGKQGADKSAAASDRGSDAGGGRGASGAGGGAPSAGDGSGASGGENDGSDVGQAGSGRPAGTGGAKAGGESEENAGANGDSETQDDDTQVAGNSSRCQGENGQGRLKGGAWNSLAATDLRPLSKKNTPLILTGGDKKIDLFFPADGVIEKIEPGENRACRITVLHSSCPGGAKGPCRTSLNASSFPKCEKKVVGQRVSSCNIMTTVEKDSRVALMVQGADKQDITSEVLAPREASDAAQAASAGSRESRPIEFPPPPRAAQPSAARK